MEFCFGHCAVLREIQNSPFSAKALEGKLQEGAKKIWRGAQTSPGRLKLSDATSGRLLWRVLHDLAAFLPARVQPKHLEAGGSRELPSVLLYPAFVALLIDSDTADRPATLWVIRGSRLLFHTLGRHKRPS